MNHTTAAQRHNARQGKIWETALSEKAKAEKQAQHTPGPWVVKTPDHFVDGLAHFVVSEHPQVGYFHIAEMGVHDGREQSAANARLIASAPEMLEALKYAAEIIKTARQYFPKSIKNSDCFQLNNACATINKAIEKAEGR